MAKFHITSKGVPAPCYATKQECPLGKENEHFDSREDAQRAIDKINEEKYGTLNKPVYAKSSQGAKKLLRDNGIDTSKISIKLNDLQLNKGENKMKKLTIEQVEQIADNFLEKYDLHYGNAEIWNSENDLGITFEAPNNWTNTMCINLGSIDDEDSLISEIHSKFIEVVSDLDVDDYFDDLWSEEFGKHNDFTPSSFLRMLEEDLKFLNGVSSTLLAERRK